MSVKVEDLVERAIEEDSIALEDSRERLWRPDNRWLVLSLQVGLFVALMLLWEYGNLVDSYYVSKPSAVWDAIVQWANDGVLWPSISITIQETVQGFGIGVALGLFFGFVIGINPMLAAVTRPFVSALYSIPRLSLVPLFILWFGIGIGSKLALVVSVVSFLVFYSTYAGVKEVDQEMLNRLRLMRAKRWQVHTKVTLPSAMSFIIAGLGISAPYALVAAVTAEMFSSNKGVGYLLVSSSSQFYTAGTFAAIVIMMAMGMTLLFIIGRVERYLLRWRPAKRT